jgi:acetyl-CoA acetyltransferase
VVGIAESHFTRWGGIMDRSQFQLTAETVVAALGDAGIRPADVDGFASYSNDTNEAALMAVALGVEQIRWSAMLWGGGGGGSCGAISLACAAIESGQASTVVVYRGLCQGQSRRYGRFGQGRTHGNFVHPFGLFAPPQMLALVMQRYMHLHPSVTQEHMAEIALSARANAQRNPRAVMYGRPLDRDQYFGARWIAEPFRLYDCCLESDGACAVVITSLERARDLRAAAIEILAASHGGGPGWGSGPLGSHNMPDADYASTNNRRLARELFARAGVSPQDLDSAQIYDHFSGLVLMALEDYGFCGPGESGSFVAEGRIRWPDGDLPINTSGGQLSEAYVHGLNLVNEAVRQLRGQSTAQVADARTCLVTGGLGTSPTSGLILGRC